MLGDLLKSVLTLLVAFALRWFLALIGVVIDDVVFMSIVAGIVTWLLTQLGYGLTVRVLRNTFWVKRGII